MQNKIEYFRGLVYNYYRTGMNSIQIFKTLVCIYDNDCPSYSFVAKWRRRFVSGQTTFEDDPREGRPMRHEEGKYDEFVKRLIEEDRQISVNEIAGILGFSNTKTRNYIKKNLGLKKKMCKWIPHYLTDEQKRQRIDFCQSFLEKYENKNEKNIFDIITGDETWLRFWDPKVGFNAKIWQSKESNIVETRIKSIRDQKVMASVFFSKGGINSINILKIKEKANALWYKDVCLDSMFSNWKKCNKKRGLDKIQLHQDNAPIHKSVLVSDCIKSNHVKLIKHPPYSPDLAPCDFWLFPTIKQRLRGTFYDTRDDVIEGFVNELKKLTTADFHRCFDTWIKRCRKVLDKNGNYY